MDTPPAHLTIGSSAAAHIPLHHSTISKVHAEIWQADGGTWMIKDMGSRNGTHVNSRRVIQSAITVKDDILLGDYLTDAETLIHKALDILNKDRRDFSAEFVAMKETFLQYQRRRKKIMKPPLVPMLTRIGIMMCVSVLPFVFASRIPEHLRDYRYLPAFVLLMASVFLIAGSQWKRTEKTERLQAEYEDRLACPKCRQPLVNRTLAYWLERKRCQNKSCNAVYVRD